MEKEFRFALNGTVFALETGERFMKIRASSNPWGLNVVNMVTYDLDFIGPYTKIRVPKVIELVRSA